MTLFITGTFRLFNEHFFHEILSSIPVIHFFFVQRTERGRGHASLFGENGHPHVLLC